MENSEEVDDASLALDAAHRTLAAAATSTGKFIQITERSVCITAGVAANFEDSARMDCTGDSITLAAAIDTTRSIAVTAERLNDAGVGCALVCYELHIDDLSASSEAAQIERKEPFSLASEPLCLALATYNSWTIVLVATVEGQLHAFAVEGTGAFRHLTQKVLPPSPYGPGISDSIVIHRTRRHRRIRLRTARRLRSARWEAIRSEYRDERRLPFWR